MTYNISDVSCGIDFGTSNSVISLTDTNTDKEIFTYSASSIIYFPQDNGLEPFVGKDAQEKYVEDGMRGRLLKSVKTLLKQDNFHFTWINGRKTTPDQLVTFIIRHLKEKAESFLGDSLTEVVLGRPAVFSDDPKKEKIAVDRLLTGAKNAGFSGIKLQTEPIAAAFAYEKKLKEEERVLVADFGGGTSDFIVMNLSPDKVFKESREDDIVAHGGVYIGGDLFDSEIMWNKVTPELGRGVQYKSYDKWIEIPNSIYRELMKWERSFLLKDCKDRRALDNFYVFSGNNKKIDNGRILIDKNYVYYLFKEIEAAKIHLSDDDKAAISFMRESIELDIPISYEEFENIIDRHIKVIEEYIVGLLEKANVTANDIDSIFMTGGSSLVKPIRNILIRLFGEEKLRDGDTFKSVAYGLSLAHYRKPL